ncbi:Fc.00g046230.m01.CDS01 [Cosmosporella sp. VM-42]
MDEAHTVKKVVVVGGGGSLNPLVIASLRSLGFTVSVLIRAASTVEAPPGTLVHRTDYSHTSLLAAFKGQDAVVNTITMPIFLDQKRIIDAAIEAGVKRFLPAEFGIDTSKKATIEIVPFLRAKLEVVEYLKSIENKITWTAILTGPFFDWSLRNGWFSFNVPSRTAYIHRPGYHNHRFSCSTLSLVAHAIARSLLAENSSFVTNRYIHVRSFTASQDEILKSLEDATRPFDEDRGRDHQEWKIIHVNLEDKVIEAQQMLAQGEVSGLGWMLSKAIYEAGGDFDEEGLVMNEILGIESRENIERVVKRAVAELTEWPASI